MGTNFLVFQSFLSKGINSMNLTSIGLSLVSSAKSANSSQLKLRIATTFNLVYSPNSKERSSPFNAASVVISLLVMNSFFTGTRLSNDILTVFKKGLILGSFLFNRVPFVVIPIQLKCLFNDSQIYTISRLTRGSPPVNLTFLTPSFANSIASRSILSCDSTLSLSGTPSAGIQ